MLKFLFGKSNTNDKADSLLREARLARTLFMRAMRNHGVNSEEANHWASKLDEAEAALNA